MVALACAGVAAAAVSDATPGPAITPDPRIQAAIERAARAESEADFAAAVDALAKLAGPSHSALVPQLVAYTLQQRDTRAAMAPAVIRARLGITDVQLVEGLLPYLATSDTQQRAQLANWLAGIDGGSGAPRDFSVYRSVIEARRAAPPLGLVRYMYESDPDAGAAVLTEIYAAPADRRSQREARRPVADAWAAQRAARLSAEQIAAARAALAALAKDPAWWQRLYAAVTLTEIPELPTPELIGALQVDAHPLVREIGGAAGRPRAAPTSRGDRRDVPPP